MIEVTCPGCGKLYRMAPHAAGKRGKCRACASTIAIPRPDAAGDDSQPPSRRGGQNLSKLAAKTSELLELLDEAVDFPKRPVTLAHRLTALAVAATMLALPMIYVLFVLGVGWLTWWHATNDYVWFSIHGGAGQVKTIAFLMYIGLTVGGVVWLISLIRPLFTPLRTQPAQAGLSRAEEPLLFAFADLLADKIGCPRPDIIRLSFDVNASAYYETSLFGLRRRAFTLTLGMPLIRGLTLAQLAGVMAHEFGHFSQRGSIFLDRFITRINLWFAMAVHRRDAIDALIGTLSEGGHYLTFLLAVVLWILVGFGRTVLWCLMQVGLFASASLMRRMEFDADSYQVRVIGSTEFAEVFRRIIALNIARDLAFKHAFDSLQCHILPLDLSSFVAELADRSPKVKKRARKLIENEQKNRLASHPLFRERIAAAQALKLPGAFTSPIPGTALLQSLEKRSTALTGVLYETRYGAMLPRDAVRPAHEAVEIYLELSEANRHRLTTGRY